MKEIILTQGFVTQVDDADFDWLSQIKWWAQLRKSDGYVAARTKINGKVMSMARYIMGALPGEMIDHADCNSLNNQRYNLRRTNPAESSRNRRKPKWPVSRSSSRYKGVFWHHRRQCWCVRIKAEGKTKTLGSFSNEHEAASVYNEGAIHFYGEFARLNIIEEALPEVSTRHINGRPKGFKLKTKIGSENI